MPGEKTGNKDCQARCVTDREQFRSLLGNLPLPAFVVDISSGDPLRYTILAANKAASGLYGCRAKDLPGMALAQLWLEEDLDRYSREMGEWIENGAVSFSTSSPLRHRKKDGSVIHADISSNRILFEGKEAGVVIVNDVTGTVLASDLLSGSEERERLRLFSAALEEAAEGIQLVDLEGRVIYSNRAVEKIYGFTPREFEGRHVNELNADPEFAGRHILPAIMDTGHWSGELEVRHRDGHHFPIALSTSMVVGEGGEPIATVGVIRDITEQRLYQEKLKQGEAQYRSMFESQADAVMIFNGECRIVDVNPAACRMYGYSREEMVGISCTEFISPDSHHLFQEAQRLVAQGEVFHGESLDLKKRGTFFPTDLRIAPFLYNGRHHALVVARDMSEIRDAQEALKTSEQFLSAIFNNVRAGIMVIDPDEHKIANINIKAAEMIGLPREDIVGRTCHEFICPVEIGKCPITDLREVVDNSERVLVKADGTKVPILKTVVSVNLQEKPMLVESFVDISDLKAVGTELRVRDDAIRASISGFALADLEGRLTYVNQAFLDMWGYEEEGEVAGESMMDFWASREEAARVVKAIDKTGRWSGEITARRKDDSVFYAQFTANMVVGEDGQTRMMIGSFIDVTHRKRFEEALRQSEELFRTIFQASPDAVSINRMEDGVYMEINDGFTALTGYTPDDVVGVPLGSVGLWIDQDKLARLIGTLKKKGRVSNFEAGFRLKDGRVRTGLLSAHVVTMDGKPHVVSVTRDIEDLKQAEYTLKHALMNLEGKNRELEAFVYTAAHDLRTPIISVLGFIDLLRCELAGMLEKEHTYMLGRIDANVRHFDNLLRDLLDYSQTGIAEGEHKPMDVRDLVERILEEENIDGMQPKPLVTIQGKMPMVDMSQTRAYQVFKNLLSNSLKFGREGRPLEVEVGTATDHKGLVPEGHQLFYVRDNGIGIEKKFHDAIFGLFTRSPKSSTEGTGVGLAIVKRVVESEGGILRLDSARGKGATFYFSLPVV
ncbi:MAG: PAS domain S-box protein [bacterium]|nr:PAS domain S-box protein [bacterium]MDT8396108.1 PAS domain S-box protein [bacterium]